MGKRIMTRRYFCLIVSILVLLVPCCSAYGTSNQPPAVFTTGNRASWEQIAKLTASDSGDEHLFGYAVDINGSYMAIGAHGLSPVMAEKLRRRCRAIEIEPAFVDGTIMRWEKATGKETILQEGGRTFKETAAERGIDCPQEGRSP
jgi:hypothetical protein